MCSIINKTKRTIKDPDFFDSLDQIRIVMTRVIWGNIGLRDFPESKVFIQG